MKQNQNFDHNHSQKVLSCHYNMDTNRVEARFEDGTTLSIDCISIEDEYGNTPAQRAELDWLLYNKPLEYVQLVLSGEIEHYLSLGCDHGILEDWPLIKISKANKTALYLQSLQIEGCWFVDTSLRTVPSTVFWFRCANH